RRANLLQRGAHRLRRSGTRTARGAFRLFALLAPLPCLEALAGVGGEFGVPCAGCHFGLAEAEPLHQWQVAGTDQVAAAAFDAVEQAVLLGARPALAAEEPVQLLWQQVGRAHARA